MSSMFIGVMDLTVVNKAIPSVGREFYVINSSVQYAAIGFMLSLAV